MNPKQILVRGAAALTMIGTAFTAFAMSSESAGAAPAPITVAMVCTCSGAGGAGAFLTPGAQLYQAWVKSVNASGGLNGHQINFTVDDDAANPGTATSDVQSLISSHVDAIVDNSLVDEVWASAVETAKIPVVGTDVTSIPFGVNPDFYPQTTTEKYSLPSVMKVAKKSGAKKIAIFYCAEAPVCKASVATFTTTGKKIGLPVVYSAAVAETAPNYTAQCVAAKQAGADAVMAGQVGAINVVIAQDSAQQGYNPIYITQGAGYGQNEAASPNLGKNMWSQFDSIPFWAKNPQNTAAKTAMDKYYPGVWENTNLFNQADARSWEAGLLLAAAVKASGLSSSGTPSAAQVTKGLLALKGTTLNGTTPPLTFHAGKPQNIPCWFTARVISGTPTMENGSKVTCP